jgi:hypothetical protein
MRSLLALLLVGSAVAAIGLYFGRPDPGIGYPDPLKDDGFMTQMTPSCEGCRLGTCRAAGVLQARQPAGQGPMNVAK